MFITPKNDYNHFLSYQTCFVCVKETFPGDFSLRHTQCMVYRQLLKSVKNRPYSLNELCPKFISSYQVFRKIKIQIF